MNTRSDTYLHDGKVTRMIGADVHMVFRNAPVESEVLNLGLKCYVVPLDYLELPTDMVLVWFDQSEGVCRYIEIWQMFLIRKQDVRMHEGKKVIMFPKRICKRTRSLPWVNEEGDNITWQSLKEELQVNEIPDELKSSLSHLKHAVRKGTEE